MGSIKITWLGHSCFKIEQSGFSIVLDPFTGVEGYAEFKTDANEVLCSHGHGDHNNVASVKLVHTSIDSPFTISSIATFHDEENGAKRGDNLIHIIETEDGLRVAHFGDLGHIPDKDALQTLSGLDAAMIPVGGFFTIDAKTAKELVDIIEPRVVIPMHYRKGSLGYPVIAPLDDFLDLCTNIVEYTESGIEISQSTRSQTAVLNYKPA